MTFDHNLYATIRKNAKDYPERIALHNGEESITYSDFYGRTTQLSQVLKAAGIKKGDIVSVYMSNSIEMLVSIYAILFVRAIVLPIDIATPIERIRTIYSISQPKIVLHKKETKDIVGLLNVTSVDVESISFDIYEYGNESNAVDMLAEDYAFCIYTSGSTGVPKGVFLSYKGILNHASSKATILRISEKSKLCLSFNIGFVASIWQILVPVLSGAELYIYNESLIKKPYHFLQQADNDHVIAVCITPHTLQGYLEYVNVKGKKLSLSNINYVVLTGEKINSKLVEDFYRIYDSITLINAYGQTECSDDTYHYIIPHSFSGIHVPIGTPIRGMKGWVLNEDYTESDLGELYIGGVGVVNEYISNKKLSAEKFIKLPYCNEPLYKTGDLVEKINENGELIYLGRVDNLVKIRGYRVELEEIEAHLNQFNGIKQAVVRLLKINTENNVLEAFYTSDSFIEPQKIIDYLYLKLPGYMIPSKYKRVESFKKTANGKIDRRNLSDCVEMQICELNKKNNPTGKLNRIQKNIFEVIETFFLYKIEEITMETGLSDVNIDSITFIKMVVALENEFNFEFDDEMLVKSNFTNIKSVIEYVESKVY